MKILRFGSWCVFCFWLSSMASRADEVQFFEDGRVHIPASLATTTVDAVTVEFKATRWGMYDLFLECDKTHQVETPVTASVEDGVEVKGLVFKKPEANKVGPIYFAKAGDCRLSINAPGLGKHITAIRLEPAIEGSVPEQKEDTIELHAKNCIVRGKTLRYEPNPKKLCAGFWINPKDYIDLPFQLEKPGVYEATLYQGCGKGHGGSRAALVLNGEDSLSFTVLETGHFQKFEPVVVGKFALPTSGLHTLSVKAIKKKAGAVMDVSRILLKRVSAVPNQEKK